MEHNPSQTLFPVGQVQMHINRLEKHNDFVVKSGDIKRPDKFTEDMLWEEWQPNIVHYLQMIPGVTGIPLSYVVWASNNPDPITHNNFRDEYISMARLAGPAYKEDRATVYVILTDLVLGYTRARGAILAQAQKNDQDGRSAFLAIKTHFEGEGILQIKVMNAEWTIENIFYAGESPPNMWWTKFEQELNKAFAVIDAEVGQEVFTYDQKLRKLQKKIKADFLQQQKVGIDASLAMIPMTMTYTTVMAIYRNTVRNKYPVERQGNNSRRRVSETNQRRPV